MPVLDKHIYDGDRAAEVLNNEVFQAVWEQVEKDLTDSWKNTPSTKENQDARERIHLSLTMLSKVRACIQQTMETGKLARLELKHQQTIAERAKALVGLS